MYLSRIMPIIMFILENQIYLQLGPTVLFQKSQQSNPRDEVWI